MNTFFIAALLVGVAGRPAVAQFVWYPGEATLSTGIVVRGELCFQPDAGVVLYRNGSVWRTYTASQLQGCRLVNPVPPYHSNFVTYAVPKNAGEEQAAALLFEELTPGVPVQLLQLPGNRARWVGRQHGLPQTRNRQWQTPQPRYVWIDGRFVAPDVFVETELDALLANSPEAVQRWASFKPRPRNPNALALWLAQYYRETIWAQGKTSPTIATRQEPRW